MRKNVLLIRANYQMIKGYEDKVVQDLIIKTDNVRFKREIYYSASLKKTYLGDVPKGYERDFGPHLNSHIVSMKYVNNMSFPKIEEFLNNFGTIISRSYISECSRARSRVLAGANPAPEGM